MSFYWGFLELRDIKMAIIFGYILLKSKSKKGVLENPFVDSYWSNDQNNRLKGENFYFETHAHPSFPFDRNDFFYEKGKDIFILMSGEIHNREELALEFFPKENFRCDPELIGALYSKFGITFLDKLNGDFSIILLDNNLGKYYLIRDHLGVRPLAYTVVEDCLYFSSDYIDLCRSVLKPRKIDQDFLLQFVRDISFIDYQKTPDRRVRKVLPGHFLIADKNSKKEKKYWFPEKIYPDKNLTVSEVIKKMKVLVDHSTQIRCSSKFQAAAHVSGGLDSALVSTLARKQYEDQKSFFGFSWSPPMQRVDESFVDERTLVEQVLEQSRMQGEYLFLDPLDNWRNLSNWKYYGYFFQEEKVLQSCSSKGVNLLFSGWGGDEFLSINDRGLYYDLFFGLKWKRLLQRKLLNRPKAFLHMLVYQVVFPFLGVPADSKNKDRWFLGYFKKPFDRRTHNSLFYKKGSRRETHLNLLYNYHLPWRMESEFILGNQYGVLYRYPLLDKRIIEYMLQIPSKVLAEWPYSRPLIREISKGILPERVRLHQSKLDAARLNHFCDFLKKIVPFFHNELEGFKNNDDLDFLDFNKIEEDLHRLQAGNYPYDENEFLLFLSNIKKMHELSKGFGETVDFIDNKASQVL